MTNMDPVYVSTETVNSVKSDHAVILYKTLIPDVIASVFIILDLTADIAFAVHLHKHESNVLFPISVAWILLSTITVNVLAGIGIEELGRELADPEMRALNVKILTKRTKKMRLLMILCGAMGLLPHVLVASNFFILYQNKLHGNARTNERLKDSFNAAPTVKEIQSVLETGPMIYLKCYYIFLQAILYTNNWPLIFGLCVNILSLFYGIRKDLVSVSTFRPIAFIVVVVNLSLRMTILLILAKSTEPWVFFIPIVCSIALLLVWGTWLMLNLPTVPTKYREQFKDSKPSSVIENCTSSIMYSLFLVPNDLHTAISVLPFVVASIIIACLSVTPISIRIVMPLAGTVGQIPPALWWKIVHKLRYSKYFENSND